jgi:hypothetical protein
MAVTVDNTKGAYTIPALSGSGYVPIGGGTMTGALTLPAGAVGAPALMFTGAGATTGFYSSGADTVSCAIAGAQKLYITGGGMYVPTNLGVYDNNSALIFGTSLDVKLYRDAAATLALRNGTNAQTLRVYRSYTDGANYSRFTHGWNTSTALLMAEGLGTGTDGNIAFNDAALATGATLGYIMVPSAAGVSTGVPADIPTGQTPIVFDSTNKKIGAYTGGAWVWTAALT